MNAMPGHVPLPEADALPPVVPRDGATAEEAALARQYEASLRDRVAAASEPFASKMPPDESPGAS